jgi:hypothetical protein
MADVRIYRTYRYIDKNPVIDRVRTIIADEGLIKRLKIVHEISGVATTTLDNWFNGGTRNPQHGTVAAVITSLGYREEFVKDHPIDVERERKVAAAWLLKQNSGKQPGKKKANGHAKPTQPRRSK